MHDGNYYAKIGTNSNKRKFILIIIPVLIIVVGLVYIFYTLLISQPSSNNQKNNSVEKAPNIATSSSKPSSCPNLDNLYHVCFIKREDPIIKAVLFQYGNYGDISKLDTYSSTIENRFGTATNGEVLISIENVIRHPLPKEGHKGPLPNSKPHDYTSIRQQYPWINTDSLERVWYYYNSTGENIAQEAYQTLLDSEDSSKLTDVDLIIIFSEAQFEGLAKSVGRVVLAEYPMEVAWAKEVSYRTEERGEWYIADQVIHEIGHVMGLKHATPNCFPYSDTTEACCAESPNKDDIMSYCRKRLLVSDTFGYRFKTCTLNYLKNGFLPVLISGGNKPAQIDSCK